MDLCINILKLKTTFNYYKIVIKPEIEAIAVSCLSGYDIMNSIFNATQHKAIGIDPSNLFNHLWFG